MDFEAKAREIVTGSYSTEHPEDRAAVFWPAQAERLVAAALKAAYNQGLEDAADEAIRIWREAPNIRTDSALTSFQQNALSHGCVASAEAIRSKKVP